MEQVYLQWIYLHTKALHTPFENIVIHETEFALLFDHWDPFAFGGLCQDACVICRHYVHTCYARLSFALLISHIVVTYVSLNSKSMVQTRVVSKRWEQEVFKYSFPLWMWMMRISFFIYCCHTWSNFARFFCLVCLFSTLSTVVSCFVLLFRRSSWEVDPWDHFRGSVALDQTMDSRVSTQPKNQQKQMGYEEKNAAVHEEMKRMKRLPVNSTYATHRLRVLNKILQLISIQVCDIGPTFVI